MYEKELLELGLADKEAHVYTAALELGPETAQNIAKKAGVNRPTAYVQIESLTKKGLMSQVIKGKKTLYLAESPERLASYLNRVQQDIDLKKTELQRIMPNLLDVFQSAGERPVVRFFEGIEAAKALRDEYLKVKNKKIENFINLDKMSDVFPDVPSDYTNQRVAQGIHGFNIYTSKSGPAEWVNDASKLRQGKYMPPNQFPLDADITIFDDNVEILTYRTKPVGVVIRNAEIANAFRAIFYSLWVVL